MSLDKEARIKELDDQLAQLALLKQQVADLKARAHDLLLEFRELGRLRDMYQESELRTMMSFEMFLEYHNNFHIETGTRSE